MELLQDIYLTNLNVVCHLGGLFSITGDDVWQCSAAIFNQNKFYFILDGECIITIDGTEYKGTGGKWFFIPANTPHSYYNVKGKPFRKYWMHFDIYPGSIFNLLKLPYCVDIGGSKNAEQLFYELICAYKSSKLTEKMHVKSRIIDLIAEYIILAQPSDVDILNKDDSEIGTLLSYINDNLHRNITNSELAKTVHMHPNHMIRFFKNKTGQTPARYINTQKMVYAKNMLEDSDMSVTEIMRKTGFDDMPHFSKLFKSFYDMSPANYRKYFKNENAISVEMAKKGTK